MDFFVQTMDQITVIFVLSKKVSNKAHTMLKYCGDLSSCCSFPTRSYSFLPWSGLVWLVGRCRLHGPASGSGRSCIPADEHGTSWSAVSQHSAATLLLSDWRNFQTDMEH